MLDTRKNENQGDRECIAQPVRLPLTFPTKPRLTLEDWILCRLLIASVWLHGNAGPLIVCAWFAGLFTGMYLTAFIVQAHIK